MSQTAPTAGEYGKTKNGENLDPFFVEFTRHDIFARFPEVQQMMDISTTTMWSIRKPSDEAYKDLEAPVSREERRRFRRVNPAEMMFDVSLPLCHLTRDLPSPEQRAEKATKIINEVLEGTHGFLIRPTGRKLVVENIPECVEEMYPFVNGLNLYHEPVQREAYRQIAEDPKAEYDLLKLLLTVESDRLHEDAEDNHEKKLDWDALQWLNMLVHVDASSGGSPVTKILEANLGKGAYDHFIARDLLDWEVNKVRSGSPEASLIQLTTFVGLIEHASGVTLDQDGLDRLADSVALWPREHHKAISLRRSNLQAQLAYVRRAVDELQDGALVAPNYNHMADLPHALAGLLDFISEYNDSLVKRLGSHALHNGASNGNGSVKRRSMGKKEETPEDIASAAEIAQRQPLTLNYFDTNGRLYPQDSPEFRAMIDNFLDTYKGTNGLEEDVRRILDYISRLDFTNGRINGLKKAKTGSSLIEKDGVRTRIPLWEFKPSEAHGLSLKTNIGPRTRTILCQVDDHTLGIAGIIHRDKLEQLYRKVIIRKN